MKEVFEEIRSYNIIDKVGERVAMCITVKGESVCDHVGTVPLDIMTKALGVIQEIHTNGNEVFRDICAGESVLHLDEEYSIVEYPLDTAQYPGEWCVNAYYRGRSYGGPEEGGWYYTYMRPASTTPLAHTPDHSKAVLVRESFEKLLPEEGTDTMPDVQDGETLVIVIERHSPMDQPARKPQYC